MTVALVFLVCLMIASWFARPRPWYSVAQRQAAGQIRNSVTFGTAIMAVAVANKLARMLGVVGDPELSQRVTMVILGFFFVVSGNVLPKMLTPLSEQRCDAATAQELQRMAGWSWVLTGLLFAIAWIALPLDIAQPVSMALIAGGVLLVLTHAIRLRRAPHTQQ